MSFCICCQRVSCAGDLCLKKWGEREKKINYAGLAINWNRDAFVVWDCVCIDRALLRHTTNKCTSVWCGDIWKTHRFLDIIIVFHPAGVFPLNWCLLGELFAIFVLEKFLRQNASHMALEKKSECNYSKFQIYVESQQKPIQSHTEHFDCLIELGVVE